MGGADSRFWEQIEQISQLAVNLLNPLPESADSNPLSRSLRATGTA